MRPQVWGLTCVVWACVGGEKVPPPDAGEPADSGVEELVDGGRTPLDTVFSIGITDNAGGIPQSAPMIALQFRGGTPGPAVVVAQRVAQPITIDGVGSEWAGIPESVVPMLTRGGAIGMTKDEWDREQLLLYGRTSLYDFGIAQVAVKAAFDDQNVYFLLQWPDPTEDRERDTWVVDAGVFTRSKANEDRAFLGFDIGESTPAFQAIGCSGACHLRENLGDVSDAGRALRTRMHTNQQGEVLDYWAWRAGTTDPAGAADDGYIDETSRKQDGPLDWVISNQVLTDAGLAMPAFMGQGGVNANPRYLFKPDAGPGAVPFDPTGALPTARIPGWLMQKASPMRDDVRAAGRWASGFWTLEITRSLTTADPRDVQFIPR